MAGASNEQEKWFDLLSEVIDTPIYTARNRILHGQYKPGIQAPVGRLCSPIDHRTIGSNELVIELDAQSYAQNVKYAEQITGYLKGQEIPHYVFWSGNKSLHIHMFLKIDIKEKENFELVREAMKKGCNIYRDIRLKQCKEIVEQAGLNPEIIGLGKIVDLAKLHWDDIGGKNTLIRCCGGSNKKIDKVDTSIIKGGYKTFLADVVPKQKPKDNTFDDVVYPQSIEVWEINETIVAQIAHEFLETTKKKKKSERQESYDGKYSTLPCVQQIMEGMSKGKRSYGALAISLAARIDDKTKVEAEEMIQQYVNNCSQDPKDKFEFKEAEGWVDWVYKQPIPFWNCGKCKQLGVCELQDCALHREIYKEELRLFDENEPLEVVERELDKRIIGEKALKMQLFLLYLTKELEPEWCIVLDGTASSGKTYVMKEVAELFGEKGEEYFVLSRITEAVLNHAEKTAEKWKKKIVIVEELQGASKAVEQLRVAISEGELTILQTVDVKNPEGMVSKDAEEKHIEFDCLFVTCNAEDADAGDQLASRSWILNTDQSPEQTKQIVGAHLREFSGDNSFKGVDTEMIRAGIKFLKHYPTKNILFPFAEEIKDYIPSTTVRARRDISKVIALIKASAYFHQKHRLVIKNKQNEEFLIADWRDVFWIFHYCSEAINASAQGVGAKDLEYYEQIERARGNYMSEFGIEDVQRWLGAGSATGRKVMSNLCRSGFYENTQPKGVKAKYRQTSVTPSYQGDLRVHSLNQTCSQAELVLDWVKKHGILAPSESPNAYKEIFDFGLNFMKSQLPEDAKNENEK